MKSNSGSAERGQLEEERRKYQRRLIPANLVAVIIALVAAICQVFMPMVSMDFIVTGDLISAVSSSVSDSAEGGGQSGETTEMLAYVMQDVNTQITVQVQPLEVLSLGASPEAGDVREYLSQNLMGGGAFVDEILAQSMPYLTSYMVAQAAEAQFGEFEDAPVEQIRAVTDLINQGSYDEAKSQFRDAALQYAQSIGRELTAEQIGDISGTFDEIVDSGIREDGSFSYTDAFSSLAGSGEDGENSSPSVPGMDFAGGMFDQMTDEQAEMTGTALFAVVAALIGLTTALWLIMALIAFLKIFMRNKRFTMWYVKLFCWIPCVLFVLAPVLALKLAPSFVGDMAGGAAGFIEALSAVPATFGGSGIVSGVCLALLWLISVFWFFPIKRKIRKINKEIY